MGIIPIALLAAGPKLTRVPSRQEAPVNQDMAPSRVSLVPASDYARAPQYVHMVLYGIRMHAYILGYMPVPECKRATS